MDSCVRNPAKPTTAPIDAQSVHVYAVRLTASPSSTRQYRTFLSPEEKTRAERFAFGSLSQSYELSQGALRLLLAQFLGIAPAEIVITTAKHGKPVLQNDPSLHFNKTHSGGLALYAFTRDCKIGIDVEELREIDEADQLAARYFAPAERSALSSQGDARKKSECFTRFWTRKEAYLKATGTGLLAPLEQIDASRWGRDSVQASDSNVPTAMRAEWIVEEFKPDEGYIGALAYCSEHRQIVINRPLTCDELLSALSKTKRVT